VKAVEANAATDRAKATPSPGSLAGELAAFRARHSLNASSGRGRKVYGITERGEAHLHELLCDPDTSDDRSFALRVAFCRFLEPAQRLSLFQARRAEVTARLAERERAGDGRREGLLDRYLRALREHDSAAITADLAWLDRLIDDERADRVPTMEEDT
jgi:DNA-binding PadR family transcriptional regulator